MVFEVDINKDRQESVAAEDLKQYIERIETVNSEMDDVKSSLKDLYAEVKSAGFDVKIVRQIIRDRKKNRDDLANEEAVKDLYKQAIGME